MTDNPGMSSHSSSSHPDTLSYEQAGVNYDLIDPLKVAAQRAAAATAGHLAGHGFSEVPASRGESAYVVDVGPFYLASIVECLGSKALVADEMKALTGKSYYAGIAQDTIAMAVNDLITVGATPLVVQAYWAAGGSDWFGDAQRAQALVEGWKKACDTCGVAWGANHDWRDVQKRRLEKEGDFPVPHYWAHVRWVWGAKDMDEFMRIAENVHLDGVLERIRVPFLVTHGEKDSQIPLKWAHRTYEQLVNSPKRELKIFTEREGGVQHSSFDNSINAGQYIADWVAETLGGRTA